MTNFEILKYPEVLSVVQPAKKLVVLLHGLGSDGDDLIDLVPLIQPRLQDAHFIAPHGIEQCDMAPFGRQWFSLSDRSPDKLRKLLHNNVDTIYDIIKNKQLDLGLTNKDTILVGFSQGTMTSLYLNFLQNEPFLALIAFSGALIKPDKLINKTTPICLIHGREDDVVPVTEVDRISKYLLEHNIPSKSLVIPNLTHSIDKSGLDFMMNFITTLDQVQA